MKRFKEYFLEEGIEQTTFGFNSDYPETPIAPEVEEVDWSEFNRVSEMVDYINENGIELLYSKMLEHLVGVGYSVDEVEGEAKWCRVWSKQYKYYIYNDDNSDLTLYTREEFIDELNSNFEGFNKNYLEREYDNFYTEDFGMIAEWQEKPEGTYYHYTTEEKWLKIQKTGYMFTSSGTGLYNRHQVGIFTSTDAEEHVSGTYGDVLLELDVTSYLHDGGSMNGDIEEPYREYEMMQFVSSVFELEWEPYMESDYSMHTAILYPENGKFPIKYIKRIE